MLPPIRVFLNSWLQKKCGMHKTHIKTISNDPKRPSRFYWVRDALALLSRCASSLSEFEKSHSTEEGRACAPEDARFILISTVATLKRTTQPPVLGGISTRVSTLKFSTVSAFIRTLDESLNKNHLREKCLPQWRGLPNTHTVPQLEAVVLMSASNTALTWPLFQGSR